MEAHSSAEKTLSRMQAKKSSYSGKSVFLNLMGCFWTFGLGSERKLGGNWYGESMVAEVQ